MKTIGEYLEQLYDLAQSRTVIVPVGMILGGLLGLAVGARSQKDAVGLVVGLSVGYGAADKLACMASRPDGDADDAGPKPTMLPPNLPPQSGPSIPPGGLKFTPLPGRPGASPPSAA